MSILEGVKASNIKHERPRFVIKSKHSFKNVGDEADYDTVSASDADAVQFMEYMINKSARLRELIERKEIHNEDAFYEKHLFGSTCLVSSVLCRKLCLSRRWTK
jgi:hypothetical protein